MAKYNKLRQQQNPSKEQQQVSTMHYSLSSINHPIKVTSQEKISARSDEYQYVYHDLLKTIFISSILIALQFVLLFMLKQHILKIPGVSY
jgi:hypothetical protein